MKKLLLIVFLGSSILAYSQVEKGDIAATASVSFSSQQFEGSDATTSMTSYVKVGYFFTNNIEAGLTLLLFSASDITATGIGPYVTYNFLTAGGKFLPYVGANFINYSVNVEGSDPINQIGGVGGFKYFLTEVVNIDTSLNYTSYLGDFSGSSLTLNIGIGINFGKLK